MTDQRCETCRFVRHIRHPEQPHVEFWHCSFRPPATMRLLTGSTEHSDSITAEMPMHDVGVSRDDTCSAWQPQS